MAQTPTVLLEVCKREILLSLRAGSASAAFSYSGPTLTMTSPPSPCLRASLPSIHCCFPVFTSSTCPSPSPLTPFTLLPRRSNPSSSCVTRIGLLGLLMRSSVPMTERSPLYFRFATSMRALTGALAKAFGCEAWVEPSVTEEMKPCAASSERMDRF